MDILAAYVTIVGLLANYKSESGATTDDEYKAFVSWLSEGRHNDVIALLDQNTKTTISIKAILNEDRVVLLNKLASIDKLLSSISSQIGGFSELAAAISPGIELSDQAMNILRQMEYKQSSSFLLMRLSGHTIMQTLDGNPSGQIDYDELRFLDDDLNTLLSLGLLNHSLNKSNNSVYKITRQASNLVKLSAIK